MPVPNNPFTNPLSKGDIAGIVIGCIVAVALVLGLLFWLWKKKKQGRRWGRFGKVASDDASRSSRANPAEIDSSKVEELPAQQHRLVELQTGQFDHELPVDHDMKHELPGHERFLPVELPADEIVSGTSRRRSLYKNPDAT